MEILDYYMVLGVSETATYEEIAAAFRKQALRWHPDKNPDDKGRAHDEFIKVHEAYEVLRHTTLRAQFDSSRSGPRTWTGERPPSWDGRHEESSERERDREPQSEDPYAHHTSGWEAVRRAATEGRQRGEAGAAMSFEDFLQELGRRWRNVKRTVARAVEQAIEEAAREQRKAMRALAAENDRRRRDGTPESLLAYASALGVGADDARRLWSGAVSASSKERRGEFARLQPGASDLTIFVGTVVLLGLGLFFALFLQEIRVQAGAWCFLPAVVYLAYLSAERAVATLRVRGEVRRKLETLSKGRGIGARTSPRGATPVRVALLYVVGAACFPLGVILFIGLVVQIQRYALLLLLGTWTVGGVTLEAVQRRVRRNRTTRDDTPGTLTTDRHDSSS